MILLRLNVPLISQLPELPTGCEITAVTMILQFSGIEVDKMTLAKEMPLHPSDPTQGYVGNPYETSGWTIYPQALSELIVKYTGNVRDLTGLDLLALEQQLNEKKPIVVWVSPLHGFTVHALVLTGFDQTYYYYNDCWSNQREKMKKEDFLQIWGNQERRAISY